MMVFDVGVKLVCAVCGYAMECLDDFHKGKPNPIRLHCRTCQKTCLWQIPMFDLKEVPNGN